MLTLYVKLLFVKILFLKLLFSYLLSCNINNVGCGKDVIDTGWMIIGYIQSTKYNTFNWLTRNNILYCNYMHYSDLVLINGYFDLNDHSLTWHLLKERKPTNQVRLL